MRHDTDIGGPNEAFPRTQLSAVRAAGSDDEPARRLGTDRIIRAYWKPLYKYIRLKWRCDAEQAKDLTQGFFAEALDRDLIARFDPVRSAFRTYLRTCADGYVSNQRKAAGRLKRGGDHVVYSLDFAGAADEYERLAANAGDPDASFDREWLRTLMERSIDALRAHCAERGWTGHFELFEQYDLIDDDQRSLVTYESLAARHSILVTQVTNRLHAVRREFRRILFEQLRDICGTDEEFNDEARRWFGGGAP